jgi:hypothetical protein
MKRAVLSIALSLGLTAAASAAPPVSLTLHPTKTPSPRAEISPLPNQRRLTKDDAAPIHRDAIQAAQRLQVVQPDELYTT